MSSLRNSLSRRSFTENMNDYALVKDISLYPKLYMKGNFSDILPQSVIDYGRDGLKKASSSRVYCDNRGMMFRAQESKSLRGNVNFDEIKRVYMDPALPATAVLGVEKARSKKALRMLAFNTQRDAEEFVDYVGARVSSSMPTEPRPVGGAKTFPNVTGTPVSYRKYDMSLFDSFPTKLRPEVLEDVARGGPLDGNGILSAHRDGFELRQQTSRGFETLWEANNNEVPRIYDVVGDQNHSIFEINRRGRPNHYMLYKFHDGEARDRTLNEYENNGFRRHLVNAGEQSPRSSRRIERVESPPPIVERPPSRRSRVDSLFRRSMRLDDYPSPRPSSLRRSRSRTPSRSLNRSPFRTSPRRPVQITYEGPRRIESPDDIYEDRSLRYGSPYRMRSYRNDIGEFGRTIPIRRSYNASPSRRFEENRNIYPHGRVMPQERRGKSIKDVFVAENYDGPNVRSRLRPAINSRRMMEEVMLVPMGEQWTTDMTCINSNARGGTRPANDGSVYMFVAHRQEDE